MERKRTALVFAAGLGTRLKPLTDTMPKALVPIDGKPLLQRLLEKMRCHGVSDVVVNVHHFAGQIVDFITEHDGFGLRVAFSDEREMLLETGGGIKKALPLLESSGNLPFLVHNVDILSNVCFEELFDQIHESAALLLVSNRDTQRYLLFDDENRLVGWTNLKTGEIKSPYPDLEVAKYKKLAFAGVHVFHPRLRRYFNDWGDKFSIIDFYLSVCDKEEIRGYEYPNLKILDVGKQESLSEAEKNYLNIIK